MTFSYEALDQAQASYKKLKKKIASLDRTPDLHDAKLDFYQGKMKEAIESDLNTSNMITLIYDVRLCI